MSVISILLTIFSLNIIKLKIPLLYSRFDISGLLGLIVIGVLYLFLISLGWISISIRNKFETLKTEYKNLNSLKKILLNTLIVSLLFWGINFIPYSDYRGDEIVSIQSIFADKQPYWYINKFYFYTPIGLGLALILIIFYFEQFIKLISDPVLFKVYKYILLFASVFFISYVWYISKIYRENLDLKIRTNIINDSLQLIQHRKDSINDVKKNENRIRLNLLSQKICIEEQALACFKDYMDFYHPTWKFHHIKVNNNSNCQFKISCLGDQKHNSFNNNETFLFLINLNVDEKYENYSVEILRGEYYLKNY